MIARMSKYDFVLYAAQSGDFIDRLRELGLVDITTTGWEPSDEDRQLLLDIEGTTKAAEFLKTFRADAARCNGQAAPFASGAEAYEHYAAAQHEAAALGAEIEVPTIDGRVKLTIPEGTQPGSVFRLRGKGIPYLQSKGGGRGDQFVTITVTVPKNMTSEQKERLRAYAEAMNESVSEGRSGIFGSKKKR